MTVKELKEIIKDVPDETPVVVLRPITRYTYRYVTATVRKMNRSNDKIFNPNSHSNNDSDKQTIDVLVID